MTLPNGRGKSAPEPEQRFVEVFGVAALQAGAVARRLQGGIRLLQKRGEATPEGAALTVADLAAQDVLLYLLHREFPEAAVDAEEETDTLALFPPENPDRPLIVLDPIDGTLNYSRESPEYAVMGAWISEGFYRASLLYFPAKKEMFWAIKGQGCWYAQGNGPAEPVGPTAPPRKVLLTPGLPRKWPAGLKKAGFETEVSRCSAVDSIIGASRRAGAAISGGRPDRRRSIGFLATLEAGGTVLFGNRTWEGKDPLGYPADEIAAAIAGTPSIVEEVRDLLLPEPLLLG